MARTRHDRFAWLRLNAYGVLVACLAVLSLTDLLHPGDAEMSRLVGEIPPGQPAWVTAFIISGILLLVGFVRGDRIAETIGLGLMTGAVGVQAGVAYHYLGVTDFTVTRLVILAFLVLCTMARTSVLFSKDGLTVHIPARGETEGEQ